MIHIVKFDIFFSAIQEAVSVMKVGMVLVVRIQIAQENLIATIMELVLVVRISQNAVLVILAGWEKLVRFLVALNMDINIPWIAVYVCVLMDVGMG